MVPLSKQGELSGDAHMPKHAAGVGRMPAAIGEQHHCAVVAFEAAIKLPSRMQVERSEHGARR